MNDQELTNQQKLVYHLMEKGLTDDEVARVVADLAEVVIRQFAKESMTYMTDEDIKAIDASPDCPESEELVKNLYKTRSGNDPDERLTQLMEEVAVHFMQPVPSSD